MDLLEAQDTVQANVPVTCFNDYYEKVYRGYEQYYLPWLSERLKNLAPGSALDVGPGWGTIITFLSGLGWNVTAMDDQPLGTYISQFLLDKIGARFVQHDILLAPLEEKFDLVSCTQVLLHLKYRIDRAVRHLAAMLAPGGLAIISALSPDYYKNLKSSYGTEWERMPEYGSGAPPAPDVVTCMLTQASFANLLGRYFGKVDISIPTGQNVHSVMFAECGNPINVL